MKNCAAEAALALKSTGTGLGTENATATIYHPGVNGLSPLTNPGWHEGLAFPGNDFQNGVFHGLSTGGKRFDFDGSESLDFTSPFTEDTRFWLL